MIDFDKFKKGTKFVGPCEEGIEFEYDEDGDCIKVKYPNGDSVFIIYDSDLKQHGIITGMVHIENGESTEYVGWDYSCDKNGTICIDRSVYGKSNTNSYNSVEFRNNIKRDRLHDYIVHDFGYSIPGKYIRYYPGDMNQWFES